MSINFEKDITQKQQEFVKSLMGKDIEASDNKTALLNTNVISQNKIKNLCNELNQVVTVEMNNVNDKKTVDGVDYILTPNGWNKHQVTE